MQSDDRTPRPALHFVLRSSNPPTPTPPSPRDSALVQAWLALLMVAASACSNASEGTAGSGGNRSTSGGASASATGGATATGGGSSTGGATTGGATGAGTGGAATTGGATGTGGVSSGGVNSGGAAGTAGTTSGSGGSGGAAGGVAGSGGSAGASAGGVGGSAAGASSGNGAGGSSTGGSGAGAGGRGGAGGTGGTGAGGTGYNPCPTTPGTACAVLPLGDSITEGCCTAPMGGYRIELFRQAQTNRKNITFVGSLNNGPNTVDNVTFPKRHDGHGGWTISQIDGIVPSPALSTVPHIVLLKIGTNDLNGNVDVNNAPTRLGTLIDGITTSAPSALVVVSAIIPSRTDSLNQRVQSYNSAMRDLVSTRAAAGKHVVFIDNYATFSQNANYKTALLVDNLHPNDAGYVALGRSFYGVIGALLPAAP